MKVALVLLAKED